jgi:non-homologous end joining protein Ku
MTENSKKQKPKKKNISKLSDALKSNIKRRKEIQNKKKGNFETNTT